MPILHWPGVMTPGQFGPTSRAPGLLCRKRLARAMSSTGMPSVMATMTRDAGVGGFHDGVGRAAGGGTKIMVAFAPVALHGLGDGVEHRQLLASTAAVQVVPPLPGVTPPTNFVPYSRHWSVWKLPALPVMPWQITLVFLSTRMLMSQSRREEVVGMRWMAFIAARCSRRATDRASGPERISEGRRPCAARFGHIEPEIGCFALLDCRVGLRAAAHLLGFEQ